MRRGKVTIAVLASASFVTLASVAPVLASASPKSAGSKTAPHAVAHHFKTDRAATLAYWTDARRAAAVDADTAVATAPKTAPVNAVASGATGAPGVAEGSNTAGNSALALKIGRGASPDAFSYPFPYESWNVPTASYKKYPYVVNGKIFFTNDGGNYVCSGTVVGSHNGSGNQNEVWTAGHCLVNTEGLDGNYDSFLEFIPAYNGTKSGKKQYPLGIYTWDGGVVTVTTWQNNRDFSEDEAAFTVNTNSKGQILGNVTGWAGFAWNQSADQQFTAFGYPADSPYDGTLQYVDFGASAVRDTGVGGSGSQPIGIGNPMTGGSSGGGWAIGWTQYGTGYVNGHNDYKYSSQPLAMYSPYQDTLSNTVRCFGASSC